MPRIYRSDVYSAMQAVGLVPLYYHPELEVARQALEACVSGGARVVEFYNRGNQALTVFARLVEHIAQTGLAVMLGVGSVVDAPTAAHYLNLGAHFIVSPVLNAELARLCNRRHVAYIPGCGTASEISSAEELGAEIIKIFPAAELGGPGFVRAILGPLPWARLMPSGGVEANRENIQEWFNAGACCVGMGGNLIRKDWLANGNYSAMGETVRQVIQWISEARAR
jgi:2-dehydro-3-deoxyphosphogluconate aldolase/(4S)-4-hydroxy-2-oxoglutarate aldolase